MAKMDREKRQTYETLKKQTESLLATINKALEADDEESDSAGKAISAAIGVVTEKGGTAAGIAAARLFPNRIALK